MERAYSNGKAPAVGLKCSMLCAYRVRVRLAVWSRHTKPAGSTAYQPRPQPFFTGFPGPTPSEERKATDSPPRM